MALDAGTAYVTILPEVKSFASNLTKGVQGPLAKIGADISAKFKSNLTPLTVGAIGAGAAIVAGFGHAIGTTVELAGQVRKLSVQLGISTEDASKLRFAGEKLGVTTDKMAIGFGVFEKHLVDGGTAFAKYGITLTNTDGTQKSFNDVLGEAADRYKQLGPGIEGTAFAMDLFGRSGKDIIPILNQGSAGLATFGDAAEKAGLVLSEKDVAAAKALAIAQRELGEAFKGFEVSLATVLLPALTILARIVTTVVEAFTKLPGPVKDAAAGFVVLYGVVKALRIAAAVAAVVVKDLGLSAAGAGVAAEEGAVGVGLFGTAVGVLRTLINGLLPELAILLFALDQIGKHKGVFGSALGDQVAKDLIAIGAVAPAAADGLTKVGVSAVNTGENLSGFLKTTNHEMFLWGVSLRQGFNFVANSLGDLAGKSKVTAKEILKSFSDQLKAQEDYKRNWEKLLQRNLPDGLVKQLADMGQSGAGLVKALANANESEFNKIIAKWLKANGVAKSTEQSIVDMAAAAAALHDVNWTITTHFKITGDPSFAGGRIVSGGTNQPVHQNAAGGIIPEHVIGVGLKSGDRYEIGEAGPEMVTPLSKTAGINAASPAGPLIVQVMVDRREIGRAVVTEELWRR